MQVNLRGVNRVRVRARDGREVVYWYAWKGGPRLPGEPGSPEFMAAYQAAVSDRKARHVSQTLAGLCKLYRSKPEYQKLADNTKREWARWLDRIEAHPIGELTYSMLENPHVRADLIDWRDEYADRPRAADYAMQVLSRVLSVAVDRGILSRNAAASVTHLYESDRSDLIWEPQHIEAFTGKAPQHVTQALRLACLTGLRRSDLITLKWADIGTVALSRRTGKSGGKIIATVPLLPETRNLLTEIGRKGADVRVLLTSHGKPWSDGGLTHAVQGYAAKAGVERRLHDARGTFATRARLAGWSLSQIAAVMGWSEKKVETILARYVDQTAIVRDMVEQLERNEAGRTLSKNAPK